MQYAATNAWFPLVAHGSSRTIQARCGSNDRRAIATRSRVEFASLSALR